MGWLHTMSLLFEPRKESAALESCESAGVAGSPAAAAHPVFRELTSAEMRDCRKLSALQLNFPVLPYCCYG